MNTLNPLSKKFPAVHGPGSGRLKATTDGVPFAAAYGLHSGHPIGFTSTKGVTIRVVSGVNFRVA